MQFARINQDRVSPAAANDAGMHDLALAQALADAAQGDAHACFELGVMFSDGGMFSDGSGAIAADLIEAHKWFNLAAVAGHEEAATCRAELAHDMTAREIAEAQRRARQWLAASTRRAA